MPTSPFRQIILAKSMTMNLLKNFRSQRWGKPLSSKLAKLHSSFRDLDLRSKLTLGFGVLVLLTFGVMGCSYLASKQATVNMSRTRELRVPTAIASADAQANLLRMLSYVRGYLATGESEFRSRYQSIRQEFEVDLTTLDWLLTNQQTSSQNYERLDNLKAAYREWSLLPERLFTLHDNVLENQPALKLFDQEAEVRITVILAETSTLLDLQEGRSHSADNFALLKDIVDFKSSFALSISALRGYLITRNPALRFEYAANLKDNQTAWDELNAQRSLLTPEQQTSLQQISLNRQAFLTLPDQMFRTVEGERYREDLYLLRTKAEPLTNDMLTLLEEIVENQKLSLTSELQQSSDTLTHTQWQTLLGSLVGVLLGGTMVLVLRRQIADPIQRLTQVTTSIIEGDFEARAIVESKDEIGTLAATFNQMTDHLQQSQTDLEQYSRTLEQRVDERTQELQVKNEQLGQTLLELKRTQAQLIQTEKMSSLGQLVAGVAHEINNPINFIHGNTLHASQYTKDLLELLHLYQSHYPQTALAIQAKTEEIDLEFLSEDLPRIMASMKVGTERIRGIVQSLRIFSRLDESEVKDVDIHEGIDSTLLILHNRLKGKPEYPEIQIVKQYGTLPKIECYAGQLNQVFMNILSNAIEAIDDYLLARLSNSKNEPDPYQPIITIATEQTDASRIRICITDNGPGMTEEVCRRVFDPFFTTKPVGKGTGMGMSISYQIVAERHKGFLDCISTVGEGTQFVIEIPTRQPG